MNRKFLIVNKLKYQKGYTLMEVILGVAIVSIVLGLVFTQFNSARNATTAQQVGSEVANIIAQARIWRGGNSNYAGITTAALTGTGLLSSATSVTGGTIALGAIAATTGTSPTPPHVSVTITGGMTQQQCLAAERALPKNGKPVATNICTAGVLAVSYP